MALTAFFFLIRHWRTQFSCKRYLRIETKHETMTHTRSYEATSILFFSHLFDRGTVALCVTTGISPVKNCSIRSGRSKSHTWSLRARTVCNPAAVVADSAVKKRIPSPTRSANIVADGYIINFEARTRLTGFQVESKPNALDYSR